MQCINTFIAEFMLLHIAAPSDCAAQGAWFREKESISTPLVSVLSHRTELGAWKQTRGRGTVQSSARLRLCFCVIASGGEESIASAAASQLATCLNRLSPEQHPFRSGLFTVFYRIPLDRRTLFTLCTMVDSPSPSDNVGHPYLFPPSSNSMTSSAGLNPGQP